MKKHLFAVLFGAITLSAAGQQQEPVSWSAEFRPINDKEGEILVKGTIQKGWHTYSQRETDAGPIPTSVTFAPSANYELKGKTEETGAKEEFDKAFDAKLYVFHDKAVFSQKISIKADRPFSIPLSVEYMSCNDMMCLPPKTVNLQVQVQK